MSDRVIEETPWYLQKPKTDCRIACKCGGELELVEDDYALYCGKGDEYLRLKDHEPETSDPRNASQVGTGT